MTRRLRRQLAIVGALVATTLLLPGGSAGAVVGGADATGLYPYFARIIVFAGGEPHYCGGALIDRTWVLTAAHCFQHDQPVESTVLQLPGSDYTSHGVRIHPLYNGHVTDGHDLALVFIDPSKTVGAVQIQVGAPADPGAYAAGTLATVMGWGFTSAGTGLSDRLMAADTVLRSDAYMDALFNPWKHSWWPFHPGATDKWPDDLVVGAGGKRQTTCEADSGGPLVVYRNDVPIEVGVTSFGPKSCNSAAGFAELARAQLAWVASEVPSVTARWGGCDAGFGTVGRYTVRYTQTSFAGAERDGSYYWAFGCEPLEPPTNGG
ncbi:MAG: S1 family peptidase [Micromonosporaceae bacterium]